MKPQTPEYSQICDPAPVLNWLSTLYPNDTISFENLCFKLVTLLALITAQRVQTLSLIKLENIKISEEEILIRIPDRIKTSGLNRNQPLLKIPFFREKPRLCAASTLQAYMARTKALRVTTDFGK